MKFDLIFFDLDGTLVETAPEICDAVNDTLTEADLSSVSLDDVRLWIGHGTQFLLQQALAKIWSIDLVSVLQQTQWPALSSAFKGHYKARCGTRSHLYPHVKPTLESLRKQGTKLVVITNKEAAFTEVVLRVHDLTQYFDKIISGDTLSTKKPDPAAIHHCLGTWEIKPNRALFVGDSSIDAQTAQRAGVSVWLLPYGYNMGEPIESALPDCVINDFSDLLTEH